MKRILGPSVIAGLFLACTLSASAQAPTASSGTASAGPTPVHTLPASATYQYDFISKRFVWSNKPLRKTAGKICTTMRNHTFAESPYAINDDQDWNDCLQTQIRSIGYMRWLQNDGFKPSSKNRKKTQAYLQEKYTMRRWGSYTFTELSQAVKAAVGH